MGLGTRTLSCGTPMLNTLSHLLPRIAPFLGLLVVESSHGLPQVALHLDLKPREQQEVVAAVDGPQWIWSPGNPEEYKQVWLRKRFTVPDSIQGATLFGTMDNEGNVILDGEHLAQVPDWTKPFERPLKISPGEHVLAVQARNHGGPAGAFIRLTLDLGGGRTQVIGTDDTWRAANSPRYFEGEHEWYSPELDDNHWEDPVTLGPWGCEPWGKPIAAGDGSLDNGLSADKIWVAPGLHIELLHEVDTATQGSWVCICSDGMGSLYASDQYGSLWKIRPPAVGSGLPPQIRRVPVDLGSAQGLCFAFGALYVVVGHGREGLFVVRDTDDDGDLDQVTHLAKFGSGGEHGPHGIVLGPDGESLWIVGGNHVPVPTPTGRVHPASVWGEDQLLTRLPDANGHARNKLAPAGWVVRTDPEGRTFDLFAIGMRNAYDLAFSPSGELFTFDSDMEWDVGLPWYRPTRILHLVSGAEYGWRNGSGKWPAHYEDSVPGILDMGIGSPTGVTFLTDALFPEPWRKGFLVGDWAYGTIHAVFMEAQGGSYTASSEVFARGKPFPVTDMVVAEDGALYITTGGRRSRGGLYRITGTEVVGPRPSAAAMTPEAQVRLQWEQHHGGSGAADVAAAVDSLSSTDRSVRHAARVVLEQSPAESWASLGLDQSSPIAVAGSVIALARSASASWKDKSLAALERTWEGAYETVVGEGAHLRALQLACIRWGLPEEEQMRAWSKRLSLRWGAPNDELDRDRLRLMVALGEPRAVPLALKNLLEAGSGSEALFYAFVLLDAKEGWTLERRRAWFTWMGTRGLELPGGKSLEKYVRNLRTEGAARLTEGERLSLASILKLEPQLEVSAVEANFVHAWLGEELLPRLAEVMAGRDFEQGRLAFTKARCMECHRIAGEGGAMGHDLTGVASRFTREDLLESILDPSKEISDQYQEYEVLTKDGELFVGRLEGVTQTAILLRIPEPADVLQTIEFGDIEIQRVHPLSRMPGGLLNVLTFEEVLDLLAYTLSGADRTALCFD